MKQVLRRHRGTGWIELELVRGESYTYEAGEAAGANLVGGARVGKRVGGAVYVHRDALVECDEKMQKMVREGMERTSHEAIEYFNVVKVQTTPVVRVTFLYYANFESVAVPQLLESLTVSVSIWKVTRRDFRHSTNPPILHRKELLLPRLHPVRDRSARLTRQLEERGLLDYAARIGFQQQWEERLAAFGVRIEGHEIVDVSSG